MEPIPSIPGYEIISPLGQGGMAIVYKALQLSFGRPVALKVVMPDLFIKTDLRQQFVDNYAERFYMEARMVASLSHPHIVSVYDVGKSGDLHYLAMQYLIGGDLSQRIEQGPLMPKQALQICSDIASALDYAHSRAIIHCDIKPDNILFNDQQEVFLTDFGIARDILSDANLNKTGLTIGTPKYISPEQAKGEPLDGRADLYSLGVILYEMLTGKAPYEGKDAISVALMHCQQPVPVLPKHLAQYQRLLERMMAKQPEKRVQSGKEVCLMIEPFLEASTFHQPPAITRPIRQVGEGGLAQTQQAAVSRPGIQPVLAASAAGIKKVTYTSEDSESGGFFSRRCTKTIRFVAQNMDEFDNHFGRMGTELKSWCESCGKKAVELNLSIDVHPWIRKRVLEKLKSSYPVANGYGLFSSQGAVNLHVYDDQDTQGVQLRLFEKNTGRS